MLLAVCAVVLVPASGDENEEYLTPPENPAGRVMTLEEAAILRGDSFPELVYLVGSFHVTATGQTKMVLRQDGLPQVRLLVELAEGLKVPQEGTVVSRDAGAPFIVSKVRLGPTGQITVYARDAGSRFLDKEGR